MKEELSKFEKKLFGRLKREEQPPGFLEKRISEQLRANNLITTSKTYKMNSTVKWLVAAAAVALLFFIGNYTGKQAGAVPDIDPGKGYMLILHEDEQFAPGDPNEMYQEYASWMESTMAKGMAMNGNELRNETAIVDQQQKVIPLDKNRPITTGYFILEAPSLEAALEVAKSNPHIKYGGTIEVKQFMVR